MIPFVDLERGYKIIKDEILSAIERVLAKGQFILGEEVSFFEKEFAQYCGVRYGVGVASGTDALYLALKAAEVGEGDEVVTVSHSFIATALAIAFTGAKPVFIDIDPETYTMDPNLLEDLLKRGRKRVRAILPVHIYGHPAAMDSIMEIADKYDLIVIEDACQAHGAEYKGKKVGAFGLMSCFSFYPTKNLGGYGDGGMILTNNKKYYEKLLLLRNYGEKRKYHHIIKGKNSRLDEIQAAILRIKLKYLDNWNEERRKIAYLYKEQLKDTEIVLPIEKEGVKHVYHLFVIRAKQRDELQQFLKKKKISTLVHYPIPIHLQDAFKDFSNKKGHFPVTEACTREFLSLPIFYGIKKTDVEEVATQIRNFLSL